MADACGCSEDGLCFRHKVQTVSLSRSATPTRASNRVPGAGIRHRNRVEASNGWERGVVTDSRGMPMLGRDLAPIGVKEWAEKRGSFESTRHRLHNDPNPFPTEVTTK